MPTTQVDPPDVAEQAVEVQHGCRWRRPAQQLKHPAAPGVVRRGGFREVAAHAEAAIRRGDPNRRAAVTLHPHGRLERCDLAVVCVLPGDGGGELVTEADSGHCKGGLLPDALLGAKFQLGSR